MIPVSKFLSKLSLCVGAGILATSFAYAKFPNNHQNQTVFLGPTLAMSYTGTITPEFAFSVLGELGGRDLRIGGTFGWLIDDLQRIKISGEWLWQDLTYSFTAGNANRWVTQGAIGAIYEHIVPNWGWNPTFRIKGFYSHAPSVAFGTKQILLTDPTLGSTLLANFRRVAGSNAGSAGLGLGIHPWNNGEAGFDLSYDAVRYNMVNSGDQFAYGIGGTAFINQTFWDNFNIGASANVRQFYNSYFLNLNYDNLYWNGRWRVGVFGAYTPGKVKLVDTWNLGLNLNYFADCVMPVVDYKTDLKHELSEPAISNKDFLNWVNDPAVYMPTVLAIVDEKISRGCTGGSLPFVIGAIPPFVSASATPVNVSIPTAQVFSGAHLVFSALGLPPGFTIDPVTGVISGVLSPTEITQTFLITVIATNGCGSASTSFNFVNFPPIG